LNSKPALILISNQAEVEIPGRLVLFNAKYMSHDVRLILQKSPILPNAIKYLFPYNAIKFGYNVALFPYNDVLFPYNEALFPYNDALFPYNDVLFSYNEALFPYNDALFPYNEALFPYNLARFERVTSI
jgi:hypothetical protein